ncbi:MAG: hypothetical protein ACLUD0_00160 [Eubacterium ramulus]
MTVFSNWKDIEVERLKEMIREEYMISETAFSDLEDLDEEDADFLQKFTFICLLNFDVYTKKLLIEKIVDSMKNRNCRKIKGNAEYSRFPLFL